MIAEEFFALHRGRSTVSKKVKKWKIALEYCNAKTNEFLSPAIKEQMCAAVDRQLDKIEKSKIFALNKNT